MFGLVHLIYERGTTPCLKMLVNVSITAEESEIVERWPSSPIFCLGYTKTCLNPNWLSLGSAVKRSALGSERDIRIQAGEATRDAWIEIKL